MSDSTRMVSIASKLGKILGNDTKKYERAMTKRLKEETPLSDTPEYEQNENDFRDIDDDPCLDWEVDDEDKKPLRRREKEDTKRREKERTLQRKKQRERKITYSSGDSELPVYGYNEDWE